MQKIFTCVKKSHVSTVRGIDWIGVFDSVHQRVDSFESQAALFVAFNQISTTIYDVGKLNVFKLIYSFFFIPSESYMVLFFYIFLSW